MKSKMMILRNKRKTYLVLCLIVIFAAMPMVLGNFLFRWHDFFRFKTLNHGTLINPPIQMHEFAKEKKWQLVYIPSGFCERQCEKKLYFLHQIQKALGMDGSRLRLVFVTSQSYSNEFLMQINQRYHFYNLVLSSHENIKWAKVFKREGQNNPIIAGKIYLIDPLGNLFMYYPNTTAYKGILADLKILLKASQIG